MYSSYSDISAMITIGFWIIVIYFVVIGIFMAIKFGLIAEEKGHDNCFWIVFFCGIFGMLYVIALPDRNQKNIVIEEKEHESKETPASDDMRLPEL